jgi:hypothetical protein
LTTLPPNKTKAVKLSLIQKRNGLLQIKRGFRTIILFETAPMVAAAASEPSSFTSIKAF